MPVPLCCEIGNDTRIYMWLEGYMIEHSALQEPAVSFLGLHASS